MVETAQPRPYDPAQLAELLEFIVSATGGRFPRHQATEVLTHVISGPDAVHELWQADRRTAVGIVLDELETEGNAAELSPFCRSPVEPALFERVLAWGESRAHASGRSRLDIPEWPGVTLLRNVLDSRGYQVGHRMFKMRRGRDVGRWPEPRGPLPKGWRWAAAEVAHAGDYHATVRASWSGLPGAFVLPFEQLVRRLPSFADPPQLLLSVDEATPVAAFVRIEPGRDGVAEIASLGRHPAYRGRGLGEHIMDTALARIEKLGGGEVVLEVAAANAEGLDLYRRFGFDVTDEMLVFSRSLESA